MIGDYLASITSKLKPVSETPFLDASVLLAHLLAKSRAWVLAHPEASISQEQIKSIEKALLRLEGGEALPYVIGHWEFFGLDFQLNQATLIPRPETELLVEKALEWLQEHPGPRIAADVGTGSGCIAVSLANKIADLYVIATDLSGLALQAAKTNAMRHGVANRVIFVQGNLMQGLQRGFDIICANLPYIPTETLHSLGVYKKEPELALDGGVDGLELICPLIAEAPKRLNKGGRLLVEIEMNQAETVSSLANEAFPHQEVQILRDLSGKDRLLMVDTAQS